MPAKSAPVPQRLAGIRGITLQAMVALASAGPAIRLSVQPGSRALARKP